MSIYPPPKGRQPDGVEGQLHELLDFGGLVPTGRGFPDFAVYGAGDDAGVFCVVEAKTAEEEELSEPQAALLAQLARHGVPTYTWSPDGGFTAVPPTEAATPFDLGGGE